MTTGGDYWVTGDNVEPAVAHFVEDYKPRR